MGNLFSSGVSVLFRRSSTHRVVDDDTVDFSHFNVYRQIGKGAFGKVCVVEKKDTNQRYAMKYVSKEKLISSKTAPLVVREQEILIETDHPNIMKLWFTFQDEEDVFMVSELYIGGDLGYHIGKYGRMSFDRVKLYIADVGMGLDYLRSKSIIHRDIKPSNLLINEKGRIVIGDFSVACYIKPGIAVNSPSGTRPYMAPEVFSPPPEGYTCAVDWWSLGITAYQLLRAQLPFQIGSAMKNNPEQIVKYISSHKNLEMSSTWNEKICHLLYKLIRADLSRRITSVEDLKNCYYVYDDQYWDVIQSERFTPPYVPPSDKLIFDKGLELTEQLVESKPIREKQRRLQRRRSRSANEPSNDPASDISHLFMPYNRIKSLDMTGKPLSLERDLLREMNRTARHKTSLASTGSEEMNNYCEGATAGPYPDSVSLIKQREQDDYLAAPIKQRVMDDDSSDDECFLENVQLEN